MTTTPAFDPTKPEREAQDSPHTVADALGSTALRYEYSPSWRQAIDATKTAAIETGEIPAEHLPDVGTLSPKSEADIAAARRAEAEALVNANQSTT